MSRTHDRTIDAPIDDLAARGFGVLTEMDVKATLNTRIGIDPEATITGIWNDSLGKCAAEHRTIPVEAA